MSSMQTTDDDFYSHLRSIEQILIPHRHFKIAVSRLSRSIDLARHGAESRHTLLTGESGTGKTWLAQHVAALHRQTNIQDTAITPVLVVQTPPIPTLKGLGEAILIALGDPFSHRGTSLEKFERALVLVRKCQVELIVFDELQHFLDHGRNQSLTSVTDWLKRFIDEANIPCVLMGLPRCEEILQANEQLRRRFSSRLTLPAFSIDTEEDEVEFRAVLRAIDNALPTEKSSGLAEIELSQRLHFASNGLLGYLRKLITSAFELMVLEHRKALNMKLLEQAFMEVIWSEGRGVLNPFHPSFKFRRLNRIGEPFSIASTSRSSGMSRRAS